MKKDFKVTEENIVDFFCLYSPQVYRIGQGRYGSPKLRYASLTFDKIETPEHGEVNLVIDVRYVLADDYPEDLDWDVIFAVEGVRVHDPNTRTGRHRGRQFTYVKTLEWIESGGLHEEIRDAICAGSSIWTRYAPEAQSEG